MQFLPIFVILLGVVALAFGLMALMILTQRSGVVSKGPRHRSNRATDLEAADNAAATRGNEVGD